MEWQALLGQLASTGVVGVFLVMALIALKKKDADLDKEKNSRIEDTKQFSTLCLSLQKEVITAVQKLSEVVEFLEKREDRTAKDRRSQ